MKAIHLFICLLLLNVNMVSFAEDVDHMVNIEKNTELIEQYILFNGKNLPNDEVIALANKVLEKREYYDQLVLAKAFILLADVSISKGDLVRGLYFAEQGYELNIYDTSVKLNLLLKIAASQYSNGDFVSITPTITEILELSSDKNDLKYQLLAIAYRAVTNALTGNNEHAIADIQYIESLIAQNTQYYEYIPLLEIIAKANFYLANYDASIELQLRVLNLRWQHANSNNISNSYHQLAAAYRKLGHLDDAYDAFWQARATALSSDSKIRQAYAELGLGDVLYHQHDYDKALPHLLAAERLFTGQNLMQPYISTLIITAKNYQKLDQPIPAKRYLQKAEKLAESLDSHIEHIDLYRLLANLYYNSGKLNKAWVLINQYLALHKQMLQNQALLSTHDIEQAINKKHQLTLNISQKNELHAQYSEKLNEKNNTIQALFFLCDFAHITITGFSLSKTSPQA